MTTTALTALLLKFLQSHNNYKAYLVFIQKFLQMKIVFIIKTAIKIPTMCILLPL